MDKTWQPEHKARNILGEKKPTKTEYLEQTSSHNEDPYDDNKPSKKYASSASSSSSDKKRFPIRWAYVAAFIIILAVFFFFIVPGYKGYTIYNTLQSQGVPETYITDMTSLQQAKDTAEKQFSQCTVDAGNAQSKASNDLQAANTEVKTLNKAIDACIFDMSKYKNSTEQFKQASSDKDLIVSDAARRICCAKKIDDPTISGYNITNAKITCVSKGGIAVSC